ncbi:hypothetical protein AURDEDRAFT_115746 [Auricularia subglabra TFB-10046 SS5]|uniref:UBC core domain-containing protein n=1 Tax=Auricularia subglabra (strain TFB-10046 / SS5) TaxID=717982 RepID=J0DCW3_AURST|nr:hypothetical protein AURDEDRAFT_115746 [Auricularia subglabra TFB-10046 SS5]
MRRTRSLAGPDETTGTASKKQKTAPSAAPASSSAAAMDEDVYMDMDDYDAEPEPPMPTPKATPVLRGRKRFLADVGDMKAAVNKGLEVAGMRLKGLRQGDEEGSVEFRVIHDGATLTSLSLTVTDTSSYPNDHSYICFALDDIPPDLLPVVEAIGTYPSKPLDATLTRILRSLALAASGQTSQDEDSQSLQDDGSEAGVEGLDAYDEDYMFISQNSGPDDSAIQSALKRDFLEVVAAGYQPGLIRFGGDDFVLSVSVPVLNLQVPTRALVAWDRRLLSASRYLTLVVSGLHARWPAIASDGSLIGVANPRFHVGLSPKYKPSIASVTHAVKNFALKDDDLEAEIEPEVEALDPDLDPWEQELRAQQRERERLAALPVDDNAFERFSLSSSLDSLLDQQLLAIVRLRLKFGLGWAGAELLHWSCDKMQRTPEDMYSTYKDHLVQADKEEQSVARNYNLPPDPIREREDPSHINLLMVAFCYVVRRLAMCTRFCLVCHRRIESEYEALKPYVCADKLCTYQYYSLNFGPSIEYEVEANTEVVDLLVSLTYVSCYEGQLDNGLPIGMGLRVPIPPQGIKSMSPPAWSGAMIAQPGVVQPVTHVVPQNTEIPPQGPDGLVDFDMLPLDYQRASVVQLLDSLPPVADMKKYLDRARGKGKLRLSKMDSNILPAAWGIFRWAIASCTAYLEEILDEDEMVHNIDKTWRQFRFSVGAPDAEAHFKANVDAAKREDRNAATYPSLYAFHGSPLRNWHSIIREGLQLRPPIHGRAYGHGVYFAKDGSISMGTYATRGSCKWKNSAMCPTACVALTEIVNLPDKFVSKQPYFVIAETSWMITRYLLVATAGYSPAAYGLPPAPDTSNAHSQQAPQFLNLDPAHPLTLNQKFVQIPEQQHKLQQLVDKRRAEQQEAEFDTEDVAIFSAGDAPPAAPTASTSTQTVRRVNTTPDWVHNAAWVDPTTYRLLPPPTDASSSATMAVQRELRTMIKEQASAERLDELGWYMPESLMSDNLFQWMVEMHSFDPELPLAIDMKAKGVNSLLFEIRFPSSFPHAPPFFRIIKPRLLPFIQGGGGHVTGGGSICMDLLVADGWLPSYSISAILLQIKLAISNLDPRPARLAQNWHVPYDIGEALEGYKRAARTHNWTVPPNFERLLR